MPLAVPDPAIVKALEWLEKQREPDYGFQDHTAEAIIAFQLANFSAWYSAKTYLSHLFEKQMDIEILLQLLR